MDGAIRGDRSAHVAQSVERFLGKEEVHRFDSGRGLHYFRQWAHMGNLEENEFVLSQSTLLKINSNKSREDFEDG
jgi:hypothetical protein